MQNLCYYLLFGISVGICGIKVHIVFSESSDVNVLKRFVYAKQSELRIRFS